MRLLHIASMFMNMISISKDWNWKELRIKYKVKTACDGPNEKIYKQDAKEKISREFRWIRADFFERQTSENTGAERNMFLNSSVQGTMSFLGVRFIDHIV